MKPPRDLLPPRLGAWSLNHERVTAWRAWDGEIVVYDDLSGDTLMLDVVMAQIFKRLREGPAALDALTDHLAGVLDLESTPRLRHVAQTALDRLADYGLVTLDAVSAAPAGPQAAAPRPAL